MGFRRGVLELPEFRLEVIDQALREGASKTEVAKRYGVSRATVHRWVTRFKAQGEDGIGPWSRVPFRSPRQIAYDLEDDICRMRKEHPKWGARRIEGELMLRGIDPPAVSTIHRVLVRNGYVALRGGGRKKAVKRFQREHPHETWQIDASAVAISTNRVCWVMSILDDCTRVLLASHVCKGPTGDAAIATFNKAAKEFGVPRQVLSDNGACFTGRLIRGEVEFERHLKSLCVQQIHSRPMHPQTMGKLERFHRTMKEWLCDHFPIESPEELQAALDGFRDHYNNERPHQGIGNVPPATILVAPGALDVVVPQAAPIEEGPAHPADAITRSVGKNGALTYRNTKIAVGVRWAGHRLRIEQDRDRVSIFYGTQLVRSLIIDEKKGFQPWNGQRRKGGGA